MAKSILITGASGFLGSIITDSLKRSGYSVKTLGKNAANDYQVDFDDENSNIKVDGTFDIVIHAAGKAHSVPRTESEKRTFYKTNFEGTKKLSNWLSSENRVPGSFIFISSVSVYGLSEGTLISEDHPLNGISPYAKSKILAENWLREWAKEQNTTLSILRLPLLAGPNPPGNLGAMIRGIRSGLYLSIGRADAKKSILLAEDIPSIIPALAQLGGVYNLTDGYHPSFGELENGISTAVGKKPPLKIPEAVAKLIAHIGNLLGNKSPITTEKLDKILCTLTFDDSKAKKVLGWQPTPVLEKMHYFI